MGQGFYQEELASGSAPGPEPAGAGRARPAETGGAPGRGLAVVLHLLLIVGGPIGVALSIVIPLLLARDTRPLVAGTADAILRFVAQLAVLGRMAHVAHRAGVPLPGLGPAQATSGILTFGVTGVAITVAVR